MTITNWLRAAQDALEQTGIGTARLDAIILLEDVTGFDRSKILAEPGRKLPVAQITKLNVLLKKRARHIPLAYVRGKTEFYGREFMITSQVLEPRPESETMIDELKQLPDLPPKPYIADVGTGSGALGITAYLELPRCHVELIDIDLAALQVAEMNVDKFTLPIIARQSDLLAGNKNTYDILLCNLPYVPDNYHVNTAASHEPKLAIFGGTDGLDVYRELFNQLKSLNPKPLYILTECLPFQQEALIKISKHSHYDLVLKNDFVMVLKRAQ